MLCYLKIRATYVQRSKDQQFFFTIFGNAQFNLNIMLKVSFNLTLENFDKEKNKILNIVCLKKIVDYHGKSFFFLKRLALKILIY